MKTLFESIFNAYLSEGREIPYRELSSKYNHLFKEIKNRKPGLTNKKIVRAVRKIYASRWHEIQPKPEIASPSILEKLRIASTRK